MHRFFIDTVLRSNTQIELDANAARHAQALRLREGDPVVLFNGKGGEYLGKITFSGRKASVLLETHFSENRCPPSRVTIAQAMLSSEKMDWVVQKATELGVAQIIPFSATRSNIKLDAIRGAKKLAHWQAVAQAACEQCGMNQVPLITETLSLARLIQETQTTHIHRLTLAIGTNKLLHSQPKPALTESTLVVIGPEGDFTPEELTLLDAANFTPVSMGPRILRTETAGLAALAMLNASWNLL